ncbi:MAG: CRTAC1 family protein, partial [Gemmataceae bacterium]
PDAAFLDSHGKLHVFANERAGQFKVREVPADVGRLLALTAGDVNDDGVFDLIVVGEGGVVRRLSDKDHGQSWTVAELVRWVDFPLGVGPGSVLVWVGDFDNNGAPDLLVAGPQSCRLWLGEGPDKFTPLPAQIDGRVTAVVPSAAGRLGLAAVADDGQPQFVANRGTKDYHWQLVRPFASRKGDPPADQRINSYAIGGEMELRAGSLIQKTRITRPVVHFGLGHRPHGQVVRIVWPNGAPQVEFLTTDEPVLADRIIDAEQRLTGSCPFLFAFNGERVEFVTDFLWSSPLGLFINGQTQGGFAQTQDWCKVRSDQLQARDGYYDLRIVANLWETHFIDHVALIAVDHPANTEVFVDERFALGPMTPQVYLTAPPRPVNEAIDDHGRDVTDIVTKVDGRYLDTFELGRFQGIARDHWVQIDLGDDAPTTGPLWLLASGWIHPTDSSINAAVGQGQHEPAQPLVLEVPDGRGGWKASGPPLGFPAGKNKTMTIRLDGLGRHFRLRTNMEIYWDALRYAAGLDAKDARQQRLLPGAAELHYLGIPAMEQANRSSPELPRYDKVETGPQHWRDLIGYHTRFGDVRELLAAVDDRYVIMNAGDEILLRFRAPDGPPAGWARDFVWVADGWEKDGNLNTGFSKTVLPLPAHDLKSYDRPPGRLEDDPVYRRFPDDWRKYHTRYVTPWGFEQGLRAFQR